MLLIRDSPIQGLAASRATLSTHSTALSSQRNSPLPVPSALWCVPLHVLDYFNCRTLLPLVRKSAPDAHQCRFLDSPPLRCRGVLFLSTIRRLRVAEEGAIIRSHSLTVRRVLLGGLVGVNMIVLWMQELPSV